MEWHKVEPINSPRIYEEIVRQIRTLISEGKLKSGDRLPPERDLAERFRVSRASVREALRSLESTGLIEIRLGEGTFVREISVDSLIEPLALVILTQREAVGELFEARRLLEPPIAGLAARRSTKEEIQEMERILEVQGKEVAAGGTGLAQDAAFHAAIASSTNNRAITRIVHAVIDLLTQSREESLQIAGRPTRSHQDHLRILEAIRGRRSEVARRAMLDHVVAVETLVMGRQLEQGRKASPAKKPRPKPV
jgi:GntR family transcriptional regulator, transcriptional repressor for pyruvate dehydrogenase complex